MRKVAFITIHVGFNFGSVLQTIATSRVLEDLGLEPICVNYIPPRATHARYWKDASSSISKFLWRVAYYPIKSISERIYDKYLRSHCRLSKPIYQSDNFVLKCPKADYYVTGSDQVWNSKHNEGIDSHYFFEGIDGNKLAYASSIGMTTLTAEEESYFKKALQQYTFLSVRESSAISLLNVLGFKATQVVDPTLMLDKLKWQEYMSKRLVQQPYVFVYLPYNVVNKEMIYRTARAIAKQKRLKVVTYSNDIMFEKFADKTIFYSSPGDILSLIYYADIVVNNSFHGTAFSINLNKEFWTYMPSKFSTRLETILDVCKLKKRVLEKEIDSDLINASIEYIEVNQILNNERAKALEILKEAFS